MSALRTSLQRAISQTTLGALGLVFVVGEVAGELLEAGLGAESVTGSVVAGLLIATILLPAQAATRRWLADRSGRPPG